MKFVLCLVVFFGVAIAPAQAHRMNWLPVREYALGVVEVTQAQTPEAQGLPGGIAGRCWRKSDHDVGCPIFMRLDHTDESGNVRRLRCTGSVEAIWSRVTGGLEYLRWNVSMQPCEEIGPPPPPPPGFA